MEVPVFRVYPPPGAVLRISTPGAAMSGLGRDRPVKPCPEKEAKLSVLLSYAATVIGEEAVEGIVRVVVTDGTRNLVSGFMEFPEGSHI